MEDAATFACPQCGHRVPPGTPTCGNCGNDLRPYLGDPLGNPATHASPRLVGILAVVAFLIGLAAAFGGPIRDAIEEATETFPGAERIPPQEIPLEEVQLGTAGYDGVRSLIRDLKAAGLPCHRVRIDSALPPVETGSCQSHGTHVRANVYLTQPSLRSARSIFRDWPSTHVHAANWWVITADPVAKHVRRILGGKLTRGD